MASTLAPPPPPAVQRFEPDPDSDDDADVDDHRLPKEFTAFLIDASPLARTACGVKGVDGVAPEDTWLSVALGVVRGVLASKILTAPSDAAAVLLVGGGGGAALENSAAAATQDAAAAATTDDAVVLHALAPPRAASVAALAAAATAPAKPGEALPRPSPDAWARALRDATRLLSAATRKAGKAGARRAAARITLLTPDDGRTPSTTLPPSTSAAATRAADAAATATEAGAALDVLALVADAGVVGAFDATPSSFWGAVLAGAARGRAAAAAKRGRSPSPTTDDDDDPDGGVDAPLDGVALFRSVAGAVRARGYRRTPLTTLPLHLPGGARAAVALYQVTQTAKPGGTVPVSARSHVAVGVVRPGGGGGGGAAAAAGLTSPPASPPSVAAYRFKPVSKTSTLALSIPPAAKAALAGGWGPPGFTFLGTAPAAELAPPHLAAVRTPTFLYPAEKRLPGSTAVVAALSTALAEDGAAAVASFVRRAGAAPSLVALLPRIEKVDEYGDQVSPPGLDVVYLPWADDVRPARRARAVVGHPPYHAAAPDAVAAAAAYVDCMTMDDFDSADVASPAMQRHFAVLEAAALGDPPPPLDAARDDAVADGDALAAAAPLAAALRDAVGADAWGGEGAKKRKASPPAVAGTVDARVAAGGAASMNMDELKAWLRARGLRVGGKKAELVARVEEARVKEGG